MYTAVRVLTCASCGSSGSGAESRAAEHRGRKAAAFSGERQRHRRRKGGCPLCSPWSESSAVRMVRAEVNTAAYHSQAARQRALSQSRTQWNTRGKRQCVLVTKASGARPATGSACSGSLPGLQLSFSMSRQIAPFALETFGCQTLVVNRICEVGARPERWDMAGRGWAAVASSLWCGVCGGPSRSSAA